MTVHLTDLGGKKILTDFFSTATDLTLDLFVGYIGGGSTNNDANGLLSYELAEGPDDYEIDMTVLDYTVDVDADGVPRIEWDPIEWTFTGPLTNASGHLTIKGYRVTAADTPDAIVLFDEELPDGGITPDAGNKLTIYPQCLLGNGIPG